MNKTKKLIILNLTLLIFFMMLIMPVFSFAQDTDTPDKAFSEGRSLVPCGNDKTPKGDIINPCSFNDFMALINKVIEYIFKFLVVPIAAVMFAYAGFLLVTAGGGEAKTKAKTIFTNAVIGLVLAAASWLIIRTLLQILGYKDIEKFF